MRDVNERLPEDQKFSRWGLWPLSRYMRLLERHRELHPESRWRFYFVGSMAMALLCLLIVAYTGVPK